MEILTAQDYMRPEHINNLWQEMLQLRDSMGMSISLNIIPFIGMGGNAVPILFNMIEDNLRIFSNASGITIPQTRLWRGGDADRPRLSFRDVNRWYDTLRIIRLGLQGGI